MGALITERTGHDVILTPSTNAGEITVWVDERRVVRKVLPFIKPGVEKVLTAVEAALG